MIMRHAVVSWIVSMLVGFGVTIATSFATMITSFSWPISEPNARTALQEGLQWGWIGSLFIGIFAIATPPSSRLTAVAVTAAIWAVACGLLFLIYNAHASV
jgi:hypothetical protein